MVKNMPDAIIEIPERAEYQDQQPVFEVLVKQDDKVIYHNKCYAMVMNMVQSHPEVEITDTDGHVDAVLDGDSQVMAVGHPIIIAFAAEQMMTKLGKGGILQEAMARFTSLLNDYKDRGDGWKDKLKDLVLHFGYPKP